MRIEIVHSIVTPHQQENLKEAVIFKLEPRKLQGWHSPRRAPNHVLKHQKHHVDASYASVLCGMCVYYRKQNRYLNSPKTKSHKNQFKT